MVKLQKSVEIHTGLVYPGRYCGLYSYSNTGNDLIGEAHVHLRTVLLIGWILYLPKLTTEKLCHYIILTLTRR